MINVSYAEEPTNKQINLHTPVNYRSARH